MIAAARDFACALWGVRLVEKSRIFSGTFFGAAGIARFSSHKALLSRSVSPARRWKAGRNLDKRGA